MCGFLGTFLSSCAPGLAPHHSRQLSALHGIAHRGPDDQSDATGNDWWMGFRRLAILDLSDHARQPMSFGSGRYQITFNGEIYNFHELRRELGDIPLDSTGDTVVLGSLLARDGVERILPKLRGMFAIAWCDTQTGNLTLARDPFGIKPLYWAVGADGALHYGSELRSVNQLLGRAGISTAALEDYFRWGAIQAPHTMLDGIQCLPPGHLLEWNNGRAAVRRWFTPEWPGADAWIQDPSEQERRVRDGLMDSIRAHLVSDVPVGVFLSGGLDSTLLAAAMKQCGQKVVKAFSIGYEHQSGVPDESETAQRTAKHLGCDFFCDRITPASLEASLDAYFDSMDQPTGDGLNTWLVSRIAAREVKVALSGLGADEWWAGYNHHRLAAFAANSRFTFAAPLARKLHHTLPATLRGKALWKSAFYAMGGAGRDPQSWHAQARTILPPAAVARLLHQASVIPANDGPGMHAPGSWLQQLLLLETQTYLANTLLRDNDWTSMAHSIELRVPFVDTGIFTLAGLIPPHAKLNALGGKRILRKAFREILPPWIANDTGKKTFTLPLMKWMRTPQWRDRIRQTLESQRCVERGLLDHREVASLCDAYFSDHVTSKTAWMLSQRVWLLYVLEEWLRRHHDPAQ